MIKTTASILSISAFLSYQYAFVTKGVDLSEMYFIAMSLSISAFCFTSIRKKDKILSTSFMVLCGSFHLVTTLVYLYRWCLFGDGSTNYYTSLCFAAIATLIFIIIDYIHGRNNYPNEL